jgi:clan AA aspartic protease
MGITHVTVKVSDFARQGTPYEADFLVDTGSIDCMVPSARLLAAGINPERKKVYELANGESVEYEIGFARISFMGEETVGTVIFGPPAAEPILGVLALESVGIVVDPRTQTLRRLHASPLKMLVRPGEMTRRTPRGRTWRRNHVVEVPQDVAATP